MELLTEPHAVPDGLVHHMLYALGCDEKATKEISVLMNASTQVTRAIFFDVCRDLSVQWGGRFARSFQLTGPRGEALVPPPPDHKAPQPQRQKRKAQVEPKANKRQWLKYEGHWVQGGRGSEDKFELLEPREVAKMIRDYEHGPYGAELADTKGPPTYRYRLAEANF